MMQALAAGLVLIGGGACVGLVVLGLPGTWLMLIAAVLVELADTVYLPAGDQQTFGWWILGSCLLLAVAAEVLESVTGAAGAARGGASRRGKIGAVVGGIIGAIAGTPFGLIVGSLLGGLLGSATGAVLGELTATGSLGGTVRPAAGAVAGRLIGTLSKIPCAVLMWILLTVSAFQRL